MTSAAWKSRLDPLTRRGHSPARPTIEAIEQFTPRSSQNGSSNPQQKQKRTWSGHQVQGLGLTYSIATERQATSQLYFDANGSAHVGARPVNASNDHNHTPNALYSRPSPSHTSADQWRSTQVKGHQRSRSAMDDLATIALATSPQLGSYHEIPKSTHLYQTAFSPQFAPKNLQYYERPSKRIKSEKLPATKWSLAGEQRPKTASKLENQATQADAELLLALRHEHRSTSMSQMPRPQPAIDFAHPYSHMPDPFVDDVFTAGKHDQFGPLLQLVRQDFKQRPRKDCQQQVPVKQERIHDDTPIILGGQDTPTQDHNPHSQAPPLANLANLERVASRPSSRAGQAKKTRKIKPEVQQESCAACGQLQHAGKAEEDTLGWIACDACKKWYHNLCAGFQTRLEVKKVDKFVCESCTPDHGKTTFVRTSSRARTAIDYAGLNEGLIKSSEDTLLHHYCPKFRDGTIPYRKDDFARIRPELMTQELWENFDGMKRPFVVPAAWNPRFGQDKKMVNQGGELNESVAARNDSPSDSATDSSFADEIDLDQDYLGMIMPRNLTVRKVAELHGNHGRDTLLPVIDVKSQETKGKFTLEKFADYYESPSGKPVRNVISLEVSYTPLGKLIRRPKVVRDIDLEHQVWDYEGEKGPNRKPVAFYCLMSVKESYTDFHIDFGGSSVYYHILKGQKTFFMIPPEDKYLRKYEQWCLSDKQSETWLGDLCDGNVTRVDLHEGDTAFIPAGWIHSVWTPEDSLVIGGNFLTRYDLDTQIKVVKLEIATKVQLSFRYPCFQKVMWYTLIDYLENDPVPQSVIDDFLDDPDYRYLRAHPLWHDWENKNCAVEPEEGDYNARNYSKSELRGIPALRDYCYRTAQIHADLPVEGVTKKTAEAVKRSIPKQFGDPVQLACLFAIWCAWKIGNETAPEWLHADITSEQVKEQTRKSDSARIPPERVSTRRIKGRNSATPDPVNLGNRPQPDEPIVPTSSIPRIACQTCRHKHVKCKHSQIEETAQQTLEKPRRYSNVSVDIAKLARASPVLNSIETSAPQPQFISATSTSSSLTSATPSKDTISVTASTVVHPPAIQPYTDPKSFHHTLSTSVTNHEIAVNTTESGNHDRPVTPEMDGHTDMAQAALRQMSSHPSPSTSSSQNQNSPSTYAPAINGTNPVLTPGSKKSRAKACEECRKSKRRCVHDEYGRIDPIKAAEPSRHRSSSSMNKRPAATSPTAPAIYGNTASFKRFKSEEAGPNTNLLAQARRTPNEFDQMIDPALMGSNGMSNGRHHSPMVQHHSPRPSGYSQSPRTGPIHVDPAIRNQLPTIITQHLDQMQNPHIDPSLFAPPLPDLEGHDAADTPEVDKSFSPLTASAEGSNLDLFGKPNAQSTTQPDPGRQQSLPNGVHGLTTETGSAPDGLPSSGPAGFDTTQTLNKVTTLDTDAKSVGPDGLQASSKIKDPTSHIHQSHNGSSASEIDGEAPESRSLVPGSSVEGNDKSHKPGHPNTGHHATESSTLAIS